MTYPESYYEFLKLLAVFRQPQLVVELGTRQGYGASAFVMGGAKRVVTYDIHDARLSDCGPPVIEFRNQDSLQVDVALSPIDLLFIDTDQDGRHYGERAREEYHAWEPFVAPSGIIVFDDVSINRSMIEMWSQFEPLRGQKFTLDVHQGCGMGVVVLP